MRTQSVFALAAILAVGGCAKDPDPAPQAATTTGPGNAVATAAPPALQTDPIPEDAADATARTESGPGNYTAFGKDFRAVVRQTALDLKMVDGTAIATTVEVAAFAKGVDLTGPDGMTLTIRTAPCRDASGAHDMTARLTLRGKSYRGCAVPGATGHVPT